MEVQPAVQGAEIVAGEQSLMAEEAQRGFMQRIREGHRALRIALAGLGTLAGASAGVLIHESPAVALSAPAITGVSCQSFSPGFNNSSNPEYLEVDFQNGPNSIGLDATIPGFPNAGYSDQPELPNATRKDLWPFQSGVQIIYSVHGGPQIATETISLADCNGQTPPPPPPTPTPSPTGGDTTAIITEDGPAGPGALTVTANGTVTPHGNAASKGDLRGINLTEPIVGGAATPDGNGYWLVASDGGIFAEGDAPFFGSMGGHALNKPIVGIAATPDGQGYEEVASDGGIFSFGNAPFYGSMGGHPLNKPVVGMAIAPNGQGYWEVASDGGIFTFGNAPFQGSTGSIELNKPIVGMSTALNPDDSEGYRFVASDGGIFSFNAPFLGRANSSSPIVGMGTLNAGYEEADSLGNVFGFGS